MKMSKAREKQVSVDVKKVMNFYKLLPDNVSKFVDKNVFLFLTGDSLGSSVELKNIDKRFLIIVDNYSFEEDKTKDFLHFVMAHEIAHCWLKHYKKKSGEREASKLANKWNFYKHRNKDKSDKKELSKL